LFWLRIPAKHGEAHVHQAEVYNLHTN
jgi:hypothetical protein